ncbi:MAG: carbamoyltransferase HypF [Rhodospirillales bacterium]|nr:carbamoyltransferase HypF [Rhodospirillales bacterium]
MNGKLRHRLRMEVTGAVQGVGFRPFVHRLAVDEELGGFVRNTGEGAWLEVEGPAESLARFLHRFDAELSPPAGVRDRRETWMSPKGEASFSIVPSIAAGERPAQVLPDLATCPECLAEIFDRADRRYRYPFTTCTHCGPRYSIIEAVPYDRPRTIMRHFPMCGACQAEYDDPASRRFHAQTNACPACGPQLTLWDADGRPVAVRDQALIAAADALRGGRIVALKGLGGFQLLVDARDTAAVERLRDRKRRPTKPFAIVIGSLADARAIVQMTATEQQVVASPAAPIVLLRARADTNVIAPAVAPDNPWLGIMLPATPLHYLLMRELGFPVVATSGNRGGEPIATDEAEALERLAGIADLFLVHDRPIVRPVDDSVVRVIAGRETVLRHARGYAPQSFPAPSPAPCLALGGHQKDALAIAASGEISLGAHIGDLDRVETRTALSKAVATMSALHALNPELVACDAHPAYHTTRLAERLTRKPVRVPHHLAHVLAGMLDNDLEGPVLGVSWDGTGYGGDGTIWGGEFLAVEEERWRRVAHLLPFRLPGAGTAIREPRRAAVGALYAVFGEAALAMADLPPIADFAQHERAILAQALARGLNAPFTSGTGRLFDTVASILGLFQKTTFEGEAAMAIEFTADRALASVLLPEIAVVRTSGSAVLDWRPMLAGLIEALREGAPRESLASGFHDALVGSIVAVARCVGSSRLLLTGGCFQNARLSELTIAALKQSGFTPYWHHRIPPNDGGLAAGQAVFAGRPLTMEVD